MTTETLKNPNTPTIPNPVGIDVEINAMQNSLAAGLPWLNKSFGRAWTLPTQVLNQKILEPKVYQGGKEYYPVLPNDSLDSYSFFRVIGERKLENYAANMYPGGSFDFVDPVDLIVWGNLQRIDPSKDYIYKEELIRDVLKLINRNHPGVSVVSIFDDKVEDIYKGYTLQPGHRDLLMFPFMAFRIQMLISYKFQCQP